MSGILVGMPVLDERHHFSITSLLVEIAQRHEVYVRPIAHTLVSWARNFIISKGSQEFREKWGHNPSHVLMIDEDSVVPKDSLNACEVLLSYDVDIVSASIMQKHAPFKMAFRPISLEAAKAWDVGETLECDYVGMALTLIKWKVFETLQPPWFQAGEAMRVSEDVAFCRYARRHGFRVWVDTSIQIGHFGATIFPEYVRTMEKAVAMMEKGEKGEEVPDGRSAG